jgi:hypothetical protein
LGVKDPHSEKAGEQHSVVRIVINGIIGNLPGPWLSGELTENATSQAAVKSSSRIAGLHYCSMGGAAIALPLATFEDGGA